MKMKFKKWDMIEIDWIDSAGTNGWIQDNFDYKKEKIECKSIGYLLKETDYSYDICQSRKKIIQEKGTYINATTEIPKCAISNIRLLI